MSVALEKGKVIGFKGNVSLNMLNRIKEQAIEKNEIPGGFNNLCFKMDINGPVFVKITGKPSILGDDGIEHEFDTVSFLKKEGFKVPEPLGFFKLSYKGTVYGIGIYRFVEGEQLAKAFHDLFTNGSELALKHLNGIALEIARLHSLRILHRDLHAGNIIVNSDFRLVDFEMAEKLNPDGIYAERRFMFEVIQFVSSVNKIFLSTKPSDEIRKKARDALMNFISIYANSIGINKLITDNFIHLSVLRPRLLSPL